MRIHLLFVTVVFHVKKRKHNTPQRSIIQTFMENEQETPHPLSPANIVLNDLTYQI